MIGSLISFTIVANNYMFLSYSLNSECFLNYCLDSHPHLSIDFSQDFFHLVLGSFPCHSDYFVTTTIVNSAIQIHLT